MSNMGLWMACPPACVMSLHSGLACEVARVTNIFRPFNASDGLFTVYIRQNAVCALREQLMSDGHPKRVSLIYGVGGTGI